MHLFSISGYSTVIWKFHRSKGGSHSPKSGESNLATTILDLLSPDLSGGVAKAVNRGTQLLDDMGTVFVGEEVSVLAHPATALEAVEFGASGRH